MKKIIKLVLLLALITNLFVISMADEGYNENGYKFLGLPEDVVEVQDGEIIENFAKDLRTIKTKTYMTPVTERIRNRVEHTKNKEFLYETDIALLYTGEDKQNIYFEWYMSRLGKMGISVLHKDGKKDVYEDNSFYKIKELKKGDIIELGLHKYTKDEHWKNIEMDVYLTSKKIKGYSTKEEVFNPYSEPTEKYVDNKVNVNEVFLSTQKVMLNGEIQSVQAYNIKGENYFKIRDIQSILSKVGVDNNILYIPPKKHLARHERADLNRPQVIIIPFEKYMSSENDLKPLDSKITSIKSSHREFEVSMNYKGTLFIDSYNINGSNFFKLRDLSTILGFEVDFDSTTQTVLMTTK